jgi:hypothetical protein
MKNARIESVRAQGFTRFTRLSFVVDIATAQIQFRIQRAPDRVSPQILTDLGKGRQTRPPKEKRPAGEWLCRRLCGTWRDKPRKRAAAIGEQGQSRAADDGKRTRDDFVDSLCPSLSSRGSFSGEMQTILNTQRANR